MKKFVCSKCGEHVHVHDEEGQRLAKREALVAELQEQLTRERQRNEALTHQVEELQYELNQVRP